MFCCIFVVVGKIYGCFYMYMYLYVFTVKVFLQTPLTHKTCTDKKNQKTKKIYFKTTTKESYFCVHHWGCKSNA